MLINGILMFKWKVSNIVLIYSVTVYTQVIQGDSKRWEEFKQHVVCTKANNFHHRMHGRKQNWKALEVTTLHTSALVMSWIVAPQGYIPKLCTFICLICHHIHVFLFHNCRSGRPCTAFIEPGSEKRSRFKQLSIQELKAFRIGQPLMGKRLPVQSCCLSAISDCSSVYKMHIGLFHISKLLHFLLLRFTLPPSYSLTRLSAAAFVHVTYICMQVLLLPQMTFTYIVFFSSQ